MKQNKTFLLLKTIGIIFVVFSHGCSLYFFNDLFPFGSFYMALFAFSSGYFYKKENDKNCGKFILKRVKKLLIPYFIWNTIYGIILFCIYHFGKSNTSFSLNFHNLFIEPFGTAHQFIFNLAAWFVIALFILQVVYNLLRKILCKFKYIDIYLGIISLTIFIVCVIVGNKSSLQPFLGFLRAGYLIPFYHLGYCYNIYFEKHDNLSNFKYFGIIFIIQIIILSFYKDINFLIAWMNFNNVFCLIPLITGITGIAFYLRICKIFSNTIGNSKIIEKIGTNTDSIMTHHLFVFYLINVVLCVISMFINIPNFDATSAKSDIWYKFYGFNGMFLYVYAILGISIPVIVKQFIQKIWRKKYEKS